MNIKILKLLSVFMRFQTEPMISDNCIKPKATSNMYVAQ